MANTIQVKRGAFASLPTLAAGEFGFSTDTKQIHIGDGAANHEVLMHALFDAQSLLAAVTDDTPVAVTVAEQRIVGRKTAGDIAALTGAEIMAILSGQAGADFAINTHKITGVVDPTADQDVATKNYVDATLSGLDLHASCKLATAAALPACTAAGSGVGKTLTADAVGILTVDGVATVLNDRILVKDQVTGADNGILQGHDRGNGGRCFYPNQGNGL